MERKLRDLVFPGLVLGGLLLGGLRTFCFPKEMNTYENRYSNQVPALSAAAFADGAYQDGVEQALADQIPLAQYGKKAYNVGTSLYLEKLSAPLLAANPRTYFHYRGLGICRGDMLLRFPGVLEDYRPELDSKIRNYNDIIAAHPDTAFYLYYIEKDTDVSFETGQKLGVYEYLTEGLCLPGDHTACFGVDDLEQFRREFYLTDHHWNASGAYRGYREVLALLAPGEAPLESHGELTLSRRFSGSKAFEIGSVGFTDAMKVWLYHWPEMEITVNGSPAADYGCQNEAAEGLASVSYSGVYGGDMGEIIFSTGRDDRGDLLVIGESYDNAILKLLACHFGTTYSIDLRYYEAYMGKPFVLSAYLAEHPVDQVLFIGNLSFYANDTFLLEN